MQFSAPLVIGLRFEKRGLGRANPVIDIQKFLRCRVGSDLEESIARTNLIPNFHEAMFDDAGDLGFDLKLFAGLDLTDRQGFFGDRPDLGVDQGVPVFFGIRGSRPTHKFAPAAPATTTTMITKNFRTFAMLCLQASALPMHSYESRHKKFGELRFRNRSENISSAISDAQYPAIGNRPHTPPCFATGARSVPLFRCLFGQQGWETLDSFCALGQSVPSGGFPMRKHVTLITGAGGEIGHGLIEQLADRTARPRSSPSISNHSIPNSLHWLSRSTSARSSNSTCSRESCPSSGWRPFTTWPPFSPPGPSSRR